MINPTSFSLDRFPFRVPTKLTCVETPKLRSPLAQPGDKSLRNMRGEGWYRSALCPSEQNHQAGNPFRSKHVILTKMAAEFSSSHFPSSIWKLFRGIISFQPNVIKNLIWLKNKSKERNEVSPHPLPFFTNRTLINKACAHDQYPVQGRVAPLPLGHASKGTMAPGEVVGGRGVGEGHVSLQRPGSSANES